MQITITINSIDYIVSSDAVLYAYDDGGTLMAAFDRGSQDIRALSDLIPADEEVEIDGMTYSDFKTEADTGFYEFPSDAHTNVYVNCYKVKRITENGSDANIIFGNQNQITVAETPENCKSYVNSQIGGGGSGGLTVTTVEVDFGSTPAQNGTVTITASGVTPSSKLLFWQCNQALTGKGDMADENELDNLVLKATAGENEIRLYWEADDGWVTVPVVQGGFVNGGVLTSRPNTAAFPVQEVVTLFKPIKLGLVSGNFKFNYSIL